MKKCGATAKEDGSDFISPSGFLFHISFLRYRCAECLGELVLEAQNRRGVNDFFCLSRFDDLLERYAKGVKVTL